MRNSCSTWRTRPRSELSRGCRCRGHRRSRCCIGQSAPSAPRLGRRSIAPCLPARARRKWRPARPCGSTAQSPPRSCTSRPTVLFSGMAAHAAGIGPCEISAGDQGVGGPGAALVGAQRTAPPLARLAVLAAQPSPRHGDPRLAKRARQGPPAMPVANADDRRRPLVLLRSAPAVARSRQRLG
jgi:hypothetical protein